MAMNAPLAAISMVMARWSPSCARLKQHNPNPSSSTHDFAMAAICPRGAWEIVVNLRGLSVEGRAVAFTGSERNTPMILPSPAPADDVQERRTKPSAAGVGAL